MVHKDPLVKELSHKDEQRIEIYHKYFIRSTIILICKYILATFLMGEVIGFIYGLSPIATSRAVYLMDTAQAINGESGGVVTAWIFIFMTLLIYIIYVIGNIANLVKLHKTISEIENNLWGTPKATEDKEAHNDLRILNATDDGYEDDGYEDDV
jgi:Na+-transporting methylmalonyl-CoA/oxaloacetate decarboxylase gamma subunit